MGYPIRLGVELATWNGWSGPWAQLGQTWEVPPDEWWQQWCRQIIDPWTAAWEVQPPDCYLFDHFQLFPCLKKTTQTQLQKATHQFQLKEAPQIQGSKYFILFRPTDPSKTSLKVKSSSQSLATRQPSLTKSREYLSVTASSSTSSRQKETNSTEK